MMKCIRLLIVFTGILSLGCDSKTAVPQVSTAPALKEVPNAEYECWKQFPIGTRVIRCKTMSNAQGATTVTTTLQLKQLEDMYAQIESQVTVVRPTETTVNPAEIINVNATHKIPEEMNAEQFWLPSPDARFLRNEVTELKGQKYQSGVYQWKTILESGPVDVTGWFSNSFPGRQIRLEFDYTDDTTGIDEIVDLQIPTESLRDS